MCNYAPGVFVGDLFSISRGIAFAIFNLKLYISKSISLKAVKLYKMLVAYIAVHLGFDCG
jgi:hypothetical protein